MMTGFHLYIIVVLASIFWPVCTLLFKKHPGKSHWAMALLQVDTACAIAFFAASFLPVLSHEWLLELLGSMCALMVPPLFYMYVCALTNLEGLTRTVRLVFMPSLGMVAVMIMTMFAVSDDARMLYMDRAVLDGNMALVQGDHAYNVTLVVRRWLFFIVLAGEVVYVGRYGYIRMLKFNNLLNEYYTIIDGKAMRSRYSIAVFILLLVICLVLMMLLPVYREGSRTMLVVVSCGAAVLELLVGLNAYSQRYSAEELASELHDLEVRGESIVKGEMEHPDQAYADAYRKVVQYVEKEEGFLDPDITLISLADKLNVGQTLLGRIIHDSTGHSFSEYINGLRIERAVQLLVDNPDGEGKASLRGRGHDVDFIASIASQCGYKTVAAFLKNFSQVMTVSFSKWLEE